MVKMEGRLNVSLWNSKKPYVAQCHTARLLNDSHLLFSCNSVQKSDIV